MTQIGGYVPPLARDDALGVHSVDHFVMAVPELAVAQNFYRQFGLDVREDPAAIHLHTYGATHRWGTIVPGTRKRLLHISFGAYAQDMPRFRDRMDRMSVAPLPPPPGFESNGLWFYDPDGLLVEIKVAEKSSPYEKSRVSNPSPPPATRGMMMRNEAPRVQPRRLSHVLAFVRDVPNAVRFYQDLLGLKLSDDAGPVAFMHGIHGSDHHMLAFAKSDGSGLHHLSWDVGSIQDVGLGAMHMAEQGFAAGWGLGRHVLGSNYFHYVRDPWGSWCEYSSDIDYIPKTMDWEARSHAPENAFYLWGPQPPHDFTHNHETAG
jgi:catechol 2,3-dioxygenase-like lactoylglutathione lyase family enzyme